MVPHFFRIASRGRMPMEFLRMTKDQLQSCTKKVLAEMARDQGITGGHEMRKDDLIRALAVSSRRRRAKQPRPEAQKAAARNTSGSPSTEEQVERSKYDVGVPTKDLSAKIPKDLP